MKTIIHPRRNISPGYPSSTHGIHHLIKIRPLYGNYQSTKSPRFANHRGSRRTKALSFAVHGFQRPFHSGINRFAQSDLRGIKEQPCAPSHELSRYTATCSWLISEDNDLNPRTIRNLIRERRFFGEGGGVGGRWLARV